jgi:hypothetical protein
MNEHEETQEPQPIEAPAPQAGDGGDESPGLMSESMQGQQPLPAGLAARMSAHLGVDLSGVTLHHGDEAAPRGRAPSPTGTTSTSATASWRPAAPRGRRCWPTSWPTWRSASGGGRAASPPPRST